MLENTQLQSATVIAAIRSQAMALVQSLFIFRFFRVI